MNNNTDNNPHNEPDSLSVRYDNSREGSVPGRVKAHSTGKRIAALTGLAVIACLFISMIYALISGNTSLLMACFFCIIMLSVLLWLFFMLLKLRSRADSSD